MQRHPRHSEFCRNIRLVDKKVVTFRSRRRHDENLFIFLTDHRRRLRSRRRKKT